MAPPSCHVLMRAVTTTRGRPRFSCWATVLSDARKWPIGLLVNRRRPNLTQLLASPRSSTFRYSSPQHDFVHAKLLAEVNRARRAFEPLQVMHETKQLCREERVNVIRA